MNSATPLSIRILAMLSLFEGSKGGAINTWDEQFLSLGTMHFAVGQGTGARFLMRVYELDPAGTLACLGAPFVAAIKGGVGSIQAFCRVNVWKTGSKWQGAFTALWRLPAYGQADVEFCKGYLDAGQHLADHYGLTTERGLAWATDRCVQQGEKIRPSVEAAYAGVRGRGEVTVMAALANAYADSASYKEVVRQRSLTVAFGASVYVDGNGVQRRTGYPGDVSLERDFFISLSRPWRLPDLPRVFMKEPSSGKNVQWGGNEGDIFAGQRITRAWVAQMQTVYPAGTNTVIGKLRLVVAPDGALLLSWA